MRALVGCVLLMSLWGVGCSESVGSCTEPNEGRDTVIAYGFVMYGGQAIVNKSCAGGRCHSSTAVGAARAGAPAGLDFDLMPVAEDDADGEGENARGKPIVALRQGQIDGLRKRQRTVYEQRDRIWRQVRLGLMPPPGPSFAFFHELKTIFDSDDDEPCARGLAYEPLIYDTSREVLRNWLACGSPIVESNGSMVEGRAVAGQAGYQYPVCESPSVGGDGGPSLEALLAGPLSGCPGCHTTFASPTIGGVDDIKEWALDATEEVCNGKPWVTPGEPDKSFLVDLLSKESPGCGAKRMPMAPNPPLGAQDLAQVEAWIAAGAPLTDADID